MTRRNESENRRWQIIVLSLSLHTMYGFFESPLSGLYSYGPSDMGSGDRLLRALAGEPDREREREREGLRET